MAKKVERGSQVKKSAVLVDNSPIGKVKQEMERLRQEDIKGQNYVFINCGEIVDIVEENIKKEIMPYQLKSLKKLVKKAGTVKGISTWFDKEDVQILLDVLG
ncbi:MAG TPA: hypothetical protein VMZ91_08075 [Candidatus Paceibacterota bacterium]|nr:hypothetical protein [Candidatus Paceibacterota bacterium]